MRKLVHYPLTAISAIVITVLSVIPIPDDAPFADVALIDKWAHFLMYGGMTCAMWIDYYKRAESSKIKLGLVLSSALIPTALGGLMELVQAYLTTCRTGDWLDFYADIVGVVIGTVVGIALMRPFTRLLFRDVHDRKRD